MESFRDDKLGFHALVYKSKSSEIWIQGKDIYHLDIKIIKELSKRMYLMKIKRNHYVRT